MWRYCLENSVRWCSLDGYIVYCTILLLLKTCFFLHFIWSPNFAVMYLMSPLSWHGTQWVHQFGWVFVWEKYPYFECFKHIFKRTSYTSRRCCACACVEHTYIVQGYFLRIHEGFRSVCFAIRWRPTTWFAFSGSKWFWGRLHLQLDISPDKWY